MTWSRGFARGRRCSRRVDTAVGDRLIEPRVNFGQVRYHGLAREPHRGRHCITRPSVPIVQLLHVPDGHRSQSSTPTPRGDSRFSFTSTRSSTSFTSTCTWPSILRIQCAPASRASSVALSGTSASATRCSAVEFEGQPEPVNLYLPEDFEGHPLLRVVQTTQPLRKGVARRQGSRRSCGRWPLMAITEDQRARRHPRRLDEVAAEVSAR